jgi:hypothetical protein
MILVLKSQPGFTSATQRRADGIPAFGLVKRNERGIRIYSAIGNVYAHPTSVYYRTIDTQHSNVYNCFFFYCSSLRDFNLRNVFAIWGRWIKYFWYFGVLFHYFRIVCLCRSHKPMAVLAVRGEFSNKVQRAFVSRDRSFDLLGDPLLGILTIETGKAAASLLNRRICSVWNSELRVETAFGADSARRSRCQPGSWRARRRSPAALGWAGATWLVSRTRAAHWSGSGEVLILARIKLLASGNLCRALTTRDGRTCERSIGK